MSVVFPKTWGDRVQLKFGGCERDAETCYQESSELDTER